MDITIRRIIGIITIVLIVYGFDVWLLLLTLEMIGGGDVGYVSAVGMLSPEYELVAWLHGQCGGVVLIERALVFRREVVVTYDSL